MSNVTLATNSPLDSGGSMYGDSDGGSFPLTNLSNPNFSVFWRYSPGTNNDGNVTKFAFSLATIARLNHATLCRHNFSTAAQIRLRASMARFDVDFTDDAELTSPYITFGGGTNGTRTNEYGVMVQNGAPRYEHDRRYFDNGFLYSEDLSQAAWVEVSGAKKYPDGMTVDFAQAGAKIQQQSLQLYSDSYEQRWQVRLVSGDGTFCCQVNNGSTDVDGPTQTATSDWQWVRADIATGAATTAGKAGIKKLTAAGTLQFRRAQLRRGIFPVGHAARNRYRKTTSQRRYQRIYVFTEAAATNSLLQSSAVDNAAWSKGGNISVTANVSVAPDGTTTMDRVTFASSGGNNLIQQNLPLPGTSTRAASVFFRKDTSTSTDVLLGLQWVTGGVGQTIYCEFNASTGAFIGTTNIGGVTLKTAGVKDLGGGYYRAYIVAAGTDAANTVVSTLMFVQGSVGQYVDVWGFQNESNQVTSYIPTTTAAVARTVDTAVVESTTWVPYVWNASEGTIYHEVWVDDIPAANSQNLSTIAVQNGGTSIYSQFFDNGGPVVHRLATNSFTGASSPTIGTSRVSRAAIRYRNADWADYLDGTQISTNTGAAVPVVSAASIDLMNSPSGTIGLRRVTIWPTGKSNADLQAMTASGPGAVDYDSGWADVLQMTAYTDLPTLWGHDYDVIKSFGSDRAVEWMRLGFYDPAKTSGSTPFEIGRLFSGKTKIQPAVNMAQGMSDAWDESATSFVETQNRRKVFNVLPKLREVAFELKQLTDAEGALLHEMDGTNGLSNEVLYMPDPSDEAACQRYGFVGLMKQLNPLAYPMFGMRAKAYQITDKR